MVELVLLHVTPKVPPVAITRQRMPVPDDIASLLRSHGVPPAHGWSQTGEQPWRMQWEIDSTETGRQLAEAVCALGYDASVFMWSDTNPTG